LEKNLPKVKILNLDMPPLRGKFVSRGKYGSVDFKLSFEALKNRIFEKKQFFIKLDPILSKNYDF